MSLRLAVFASGSGTNLQALIDHFNARTTGPAAAAMRVSLVVSDRADARALQRARDAGIETSVINVSRRPVDFVARETLAAVEAADVDLIALAGYLRLVPAAVVRRYRARIVNIHPALLPAFGGKGMYGLRVHEAVLAAGCTVSGATVHYVDENYDQGRILAQWPVPVLPDDTPDTLAGRVRMVEHSLYPAALELAARTLSQEAAAVARVSARAFAYSTLDAPSASQIREALGLE